MLLFYHPPELWPMRLDGKFALEYSVERVQYLNLTTKSLKYRKSYSIQIFWPTRCRTISPLCLWTVLSRRQTGSAQRASHEKCTRQGRTVLHSDGEVLHMVLHTNSFFVYIDFSFLYFHDHLQNQFIGHH
jgi:hypothetical protein